MIHNSTIQNKKFLNLSNIKSNYFIALFLFVFSFSISQAQQKPSTPKNLALSESFDASGMPSIKLTWERGNDGVIPDYYYVYSLFKNGKDDDENYEYVIGTVLEVNSNNPTFELVFFKSQLNRGENTFYVKAIKGSNDNREIFSQTSNIISYFNDYNDPFMLYADRANNHGQITKVGDLFQVYTYTYGIDEDCDVTIEKSFDETALKFISEENPNIDDSINYKGIRIYTFEALRNGIHTVDFSAIACTGEEASFALMVEIGISRNGEIMFFEHSNKFVKYYFSSNEDLTINFPVTKIIDFDCPIEYNIDQSTLTNATIDNNGNILVPNIPENYGKQYINVSAIIEDCDIEGQNVNAIANGWHEFVILDESQKPNSKLVGKVTDKETGEPVGGAIITLYMINSDGSNGRDTNFYYEDYYHTSTDSDGNYSIDVNAGEYVLVVQGYGYQVYYNLKDPNTLEGLKIEANSTIEFNVELEKEIIPNLVTFSGQVTNATTGEGVAYAYVEYIPYELIEKGGVIGVGPDGNPIDWGHNFYGQFVTKTDEKGNYTIQVYDNTTYVARAIAFDWNTGLPYGEEYYNEKSNPFDAEILDPKVDYFAPINFTIEEYQEQLGTISGTSVNDRNEAIPATVLAIQINDRNANNRQNVFTAIAREGNFYFDNLPYGRYMLLSVPMTMEHIPGYYVSNDFASLNWNDATIIGVDDATVALNYTIMHKELIEGEEGIADFEGKINKRGGIVKDGNGKQSAQGLSGVTVYLLNDNGGILDYKFTDKDGKFKFNNLAEGKYSIVTDKMGYHSSNTTFEIKYAEGVKITKSMEMEEDLTMSVEDEVINNIKVMPQPANTNARIEFLSNNGIMEASIIDQNGKLIDVMNINAVDGVNFIDVNTTNYSNGTYFVIFNQNGSSKSTKFNVVK